MNAFARPNVFVVLHTPRAEAQRERAAWYERLVFAYEANYIPVPLEVRALLQVKPTHLLRTLALHWEKRLKERYEEVVPVVPNVGGSRFRKPDPIAKAERQYHGDSRPV